MRLGIVSISPEGQRLIERAGLNSERIYAEIARRFGPAKIAELMELLRQLETILGEGDPISGGDQQNMVPDNRSQERRRGRPPTSRGDE